MKHSLNIVLIVSIAVLISACSNADMDHYRAAGPGDWSAAGAGSSPRSGGTQAPRRCYQTSSTHQTCFD